MRMLSETVKFDWVYSGTTSGTSTVYSTGVNMANYDGVAFSALFGTAASNNTVKVQQSDDDGSADDYTDLTGTSVTVGASDEALLVDVYRPTKKFVRLAMVRGTSTTVIGAMAFRYGARSLVTNGVSGTMAAEKHFSPAEGTA